MKTTALLRKILDQLVTDRAVLDVQSIETALGVVAGPPAAESRLRPPPRKRRGRRKTDPQSFARTLAFVRARRDAGAVTISTRQVAREFGISLPAATQRMLSLLGAGKVERHSRGHYVPVGRWSKLAESASTTRASAN